MSQSILLVVTEINPGIKTLIKQQPATQTLGYTEEKPETALFHKRRQEKVLFRPRQGKPPRPNNTETQHRSTTREEPPKHQGVPRGKHVNSPVTQIGTGNSPVQKNFHTKKAPIQPNRGTYSM